MVESGSLFSIGAAARPWAATSNRPARSKTADDGAAWCRRHGESHGLKTPFRLKAHAVSRAASTPGWRLFGEGLQTPPFSATAGLPSPTDGPCWTCGPRSGKVGRPCHNRGRLWLPDGAEKDCQGFALRSEKAVMVRPSSADSLYRPPCARYLAKTEKSGIFSLAMILASFARSGPPATAAPGAPARTGRS